MAWDKPTEDLVVRFAASLPSNAAVERRKMFGCPCAFTGGNMFAGLHEQNLILRLPAETRAALIAAQAARPFVVMGRSMREYVAVADAGAKDARVIAALVNDAFTFAAGLPVKEKKAKTSQAKTIQKKAKIRGVRRAIDP